MSSIGKITSSLVTANNANSLALANVNFDFSLCKVNAPKEFHALGEFLTSQRRETAEDGALHQTARRLGSLFHDALPRTPRLVQAYGRRVSEISQDLKENIKGKAATSYGPFDNHVGLDASSIWAGATSGPSAIAVHLLACMLAHTWSGPEAVSIWSELVAERKKEIESDCGNGEMYSIATLMAARQDIRRSDFAEWDASARSWLRSANSVKLKEHKQLMLIIDNVDMAVSNTAMTYLNVLTAWKTAMQGLENLLNGTCQRVQNGAVLLGFAAWHIFPDIVVLSQKMTEVHFKDHLVPPHALLEIGVQKTGGEDGKGMFWSLSLAHLRYYGAAVSVSRSPTYDENRVSIDQLHIMALGSIINGWGINVKGNDFNPILDIFRFLGQRLDFNKKIFKDCWLLGLVQAAYTIQHASGIDAKYALLLFSYGRHQGKALIPRTPTLFNLATYSRMIQLSEDNEARITILRDAAQSFNLDPDQCVIRYRNSNMDIQGHFEYASAVKSVTSLKRSASQSDVRPETHCRWIDVEVACSVQKQPVCLNCSLHHGKIPKAGNVERRQQIKTSEFEDCQQLFEHVKCLKGYREGNVFKLSDSNLRTTSKDPPVVILSYQYSGLGPLAAISSGQDSELESPTRNRRQKYRNWAESLHHQDYIMVLGDENEAGLFVAESAIQKEENFARSQPNLETWKLLMHQIPVRALEKHFLYHEEWMEERSTRSLRALATASSLYKAFPDATIPLRICSRALGKASWIPKRYHWDETSDVIFRLTRAEKFACLALFESGTCNIQPDALSRVMAMSTGDSLYIAECLLSDPSVEHSHSRIRRVIGNIGRPGISMLLSPGNVQIRKQKIDSWMLVDPMPFDGIKTDSFSTTSMHLSFTGYELPIGNGPTGGRDVEAAIVETAISVLESGEWVADVDLMGGESEGFRCLFDKPSSKMHRFVKLPERVRFGETLDCDHGTRVPSEFCFNSIDTWDGLLADLNAPGLVRAHGNRIARIATTAVNLQIGRIVHILPENCCLQCVNDSFGSEGIHELSNSIVVIL